MARTIHLYDWLSQPFSDAARRFAIRLKRQVVAGRPYICREANLWDAKWSMRMAHAQFISICEHDDKTCGFWGAQFREARIAFPAYRHIIMYDHVCTYGMSHPTCYQTMLSWARLSLRLSLLCNQSEHLSQSVWMHSDGSTWMKQAE